MAKSGRWGIHSEDETLEVIKAAGVHGCCGAFDLEERLFGRSPFCVGVIARSAIYVSNLKVPPEVGHNVMVWAMCLWCAVYFYRDNFSGALVDHILTKLEPLTPERLEEAKRNLLIVHEELTA